MKKCLIFLLCALMLLSVSACGQEPDDTHIPMDEEPSGNPVYVNDSAVNSFLVDFCKLTNITPQGIHKDHDLNCFVFRYNDCDMQMISTPQGLYVNILGGADQAAFDRMWYVFQRVCAVGDPSCTEEQMDLAEAFMKKQTTTSGGFNVTSHVEILAFTPIIQNETIHIDCHVELLLRRYLPVEE